MVGMGYEDRFDAVNVVLCDHLIDHRRITWLASHNVFQKRRSSEMTIEEDLVFPVIKHQCRRSEKCDFHMLSSCRRSL